MHERTTEYPRTSLSIIIQSDYFSNYSLVYNDSTEEELENETEHAWVL